MALRINTNVESMRAQAELAENREKLDISQNKLSTGSRITRALDDAAGLAISENLRNTIRSTNQNIRNAMDAMNMLEVAEGSMSEITNLIIRMKELAIQSANGTNSDNERGYLNDEYQALKAEIDRISNTTMYNERHLINGQGGSTVIQVGPNNQDPDRIDVTTTYDITLDSLGLAGLDISTLDSSREAIEPVGDALKILAKARGMIGANESRISAAIGALKEFEINSSAGFSRIRDADIANETAERTKRTILTQAGIAVLAQANNTPQLALKLLE